jgi:hypothetical protein
MAACVESDPQCALAHTCSSVGLVVVVYCGNTGLRSVARLRRPMDGVQRVAGGLGC